MLNLDTPPNGRLAAPRAWFTAAPAPQFDASWATTWTEVREAQRLRYRVLALEMGARVPSQRLGLDADGLDAYCDHLLVRAAPHDAPIGTCRVLSNAQAAAAGGFSIDHAFDLTPLERLRPSMAEVGRVCVDARHRQGDVIAKLWRALADHMSENQVATMIGCCSIPLADGGRAAAALWRRLSRTHAVRPEWRVQARLPYPVHLLEADHEGEAPELLKGYLRLGARVLGPPGWNPSFGCAELPLMLQFDDIAALS